jgi:hypothetical protein
MKMYKDQVKEVSTDAAELPQIRFPIKGTKNATELAADKDDIEKLGKVVAGAFGAIASATGLSEKEVLHVLEDIHVDMLKDVLKEGIDVDVLKNGIQEAIKTISLATALDTEQITEVFTAKRNTSLNDIVNRLHDRSQLNREKFGT